MPIMISGGVAHKLPEDIKKKLITDKKALIKWEDITPLARNEWICWVSSPKKIETRNMHLARMLAELKGGKRRPCCWAGCIHRTDKKLSPSQKFVLNK